MAVSAYPRITKACNERRKKCGMVENWTWKPGIIPAIKQDIVELFPRNRADQSRVYALDSVAGILWSVSWNSVSTCATHDKWIGGVLKNDETTMSRKDPWALTAAGSAIQVLKAPIKGSCESRLRIGDAWNFRRDEVAAQETGSQLFLPHNK